MLETIAIILIILWLLGMVSGYMLGNFIWILLDRYTAPNENFVPVLRPEVRAV